MDQQPAKRGRGRPRKDAGNDFEPAINVDGNTIATSLDEATGDDGNGSVIDPRAIGIGDGASGGSDSRSAGVGTPRKRGRKPGSGSRKAAASPVSVSGVEKLLFSIHAMGASFLKTPELMIDQSEAALLAGAVVEVSKHYEILGGVSDKAVAWVNLAQCVGMIYGPRVVALKMRKAGDRQESGQEILQPHGLHVVT